MNKLSWQYIYNLFVQAAEDVPSWAPEWVKKHPHFEQYKSLEDIPKSFPIKYYREPIQIEEGTKQEIQKSIDAHAGRLINGAASQVSRIIDNVAHFLERDNIFSINAILKEVNNSIKYYDEMFQNYFSKIEKVKNIILKINSENLNYSDMFKHGTLPNPDIFKDLIGYQENIEKLSHQIIDYNYDINLFKRRVVDFEKNKQLAENLKESAQLINDENDYNKFMYTPGNRFLLFHYHDYLGNAEWVGKIKDLDPFDDQNKVTQEYKNKIDEYLNFMIKKYDVLIEDWNKSIKDKEQLIQELIIKRNEYFNSPKVKKELINLFEREMSSYNKELEKSKKILDDYHDLLRKYNERLSTHGKEDDLFHQNKEIFTKSLLSVSGEIEESGWGKMKEIYIANINSPEPKYDLNSFFALPNTFRMVFKVNTPVGIQNKTFNFPAGTPLTTFCKNVASIMRKYFSNTVIRYPGTIEKLENVAELQDVKEMRDYISIYSQQSKQDLENNFEIVFSSKASDVLTMSTRSFWTSCQNFLNNTDYSQGAINSAVSKYAAIIYATNKQDFRKRGEQMIARAVVFLLKDEDSEDYVLFLGPPYATGNITSKYFDDEFKKSLKRNFPNMEIYTDDPPYNYYFPIEGEAAGKPYFDVQLRTKKI